MAELIWSPEAAEDLEEICDFIAKDSEHYAKIFAQHIMSIVEDIPTFPMSGRIVPEFGDGSIREKIHHNYRIVYRLKNGTVEIVAITHGARLMNDFEK